MSHEAPGLACLQWLCSPAGVCGIPPPPWAARMAPPSPGSQPSLSAAFSGTTPSTRPGCPFLPAQRTPRSSSGRHRSLHRTFIYFRETAGAGRTEREHERFQADSTLTGEPGGGLDPRALRSGPEPKRESGAPEPRSHPGGPQPASRLTLPVWPFALGSDFAALAETQDGASQSWPRRSHPLPVPRPVPAWTWAAAALSFLPSRGLWTDTDSPQGHTLPAPVHTAGEGGGREEPLNPRALHASPPPRLAASQEKAGSGTRSAPSRLRRTWASVPSNSPYPSPGGAEPSQPA